MANLVALHIDKDTGEIVARGGTTGGGGSGAGYLFEQLTPALQWTVPHSQSSDLVLVQVYDELGELTIPDSVVILDLQSIEINFLDAMAGTAHLIFFTS